MQIPYLLVRDAVWFGCTPFSLKKGLIIVIAQKISLRLRFGA